MVKKKEEQTKKMVTISEDEYEMLYSDSRFMDALYKANLRKTKVFKEAQKIFTYEKHQCKPANERNN